MTAEPRMPGVDPLTTRLARGESEAFLEVYDAYGSRLHAYALGLLGDRQAAEDVLQTVMLRLVRHRDRLRAVEHLKAWLYVVARNEAYRRRGRDARASPALDPAAFETGTAPTSATPDLEALQGALLHLSRERYEVVTLKVHHDLTFAEIGEVLDLSPNTAASRYRRALADLRLLLETADVER